MSMTWKIDPGTNDISIVGGKLVMTQGEDEVCQRVRITLSHFWYEYWLNLQGGVPWYELILGGKDPALAEVVLRKVVLAVPNVLKTLVFNASFKNRAISIQTTLEVQTVSGIQSTTIEV